MGLSPPDCGVRVTGTASRHAAFTVSESRQRLAARRGGGTTRRLPRRREGPSSQGEPPPGCRSRVTGRPWLASTQPRRRAAREHEPVDGPARASSSDAGGRPPPHCPLTSRNEGHAWQVGIRRVLGVAERSRRPRPGPGRPRFTWPTRPGDTDRRPCSRPGDEAPRSLCPSTPGPVPIRFRCLKAAHASRHYRYVYDELCPLDHASPCRRFPGRSPEHRPILPGCAGATCWGQDRSGECLVGPPYEAAAESSPSAHRAVCRSATTLHALPAAHRHPSLIWRQDASCGRRRTRSRPLPRRRSRSASPRARQRTGPDGLPPAPSCTAPSADPLIVLTAAGASEPRGLSSTSSTSTHPREGVNLIAIVGDAFAKPTPALESAPERWDLSRLARLTSSAYMFSDSQADLLSSSPAADHRAFSSS